MMHAAPFCNGDLGFEVVSPEFQKVIVNNVNTLCGFRNTDQFPGQMPISIERKHFDQLRRGQYAVAKKADGIRYILYFFTTRSERCAVLINRSCKCTIVPNQLVFRDDHIYRGTVLDGELAQTKNDTWKFLIFDTIVMTGEHLRKLSLFQRLSAASDYIHENYAYDKFTSPFMLLVKRAVPLNQLRQLLAEDMANSDYATDGLVLTPMHESPRQGTNFALFKWKSADTCTAEFIVRYEGNESFALYARNRKRGTVKVDTLKSATLYRETREFLEKVFNIQQPVNIFDKLEMDAKIKKQLVETNVADKPVIMECQYNELWKKWIPFKLRDDRDAPNSLFTIERTLVNIQENIMIDEFFDI